MLTIAERRRLDAGLELVKIVSLTNSLVRYDISIGSIPTISKQEGKRIEAWLREHKHIIYGSLPISRQMFKGRKPADVDIVVEYPYLAALRIKDILDKEPHFSYPTRVVTQPNGRYEVQVKKSGKWVVAVDLHAINTYFVTYDLYGSTLSPYSQDGLYIQKLTDQLLRKANSIMSYDPYIGKFGPSPHREIKDTLDFINIAKMLISSSEVRVKAVLQKIKNHPNIVPDYVRTDIRLTVERIKRAKQLIKVWEQYYSTLKNRKSVVKQAIPSKYESEYINYVLKYPQFSVKDIKFTSQGLRSVNEPPKLKK